MKTFFKKRWYFFIPLIFLAITAFGFVIMALWNFTMPAIFNLPQITFWQSLAILLLSRILFGGGGTKHFRRGGAPWSKHFRERWEKMKPEDRDKFYQRWNSRCCPTSSKKEEAPIQ
jgi:hypothetical protein